MLLGLAWTILLIAGCSRQEPKSYVARVDRSYLTDAELPAAIDSGSGADRQALDFINSWVASELLYQEAVKRGLADTEEIRRRLEQTRKHLAIDALLNEEIYNSDSAQVSEQAVRALFNTNAQDLRLREDVVNLSYIKSSERAAANDFRSRVLRGASWEDALHHMQGDSVLRQALLQSVQRRYFTKATLYPEELWRLARTLDEEEVSFVLTTNAGSYVLTVHSFKRQGELPDWEYIKDELRERLLIKERRRLYEKLLGKLRKKHTVELYVGTADTVGTTE